MRKIRLNKGNFKGVCAIVDDDDYEFLNKLSWCTGGAAKGKSQYAMHQKIRMHRTILERMGLNLKGKEVDHINCNKLDNRKSNLRIATHQENSRNFPRRKIGLSKYRGVWYRKGPGRVKRWVVELKVNYKKVYVGTFMTEKEAGIAYNKKVREIYKEFAYQNKI